MGNNTAPLSVLKLEHIVFDNLHFERHGFRNPDAPDAEVNIGTGVHKDSEGQYRVSLHIAVKKENEYVASVQVTGFCEIDENCPGKDDLLKRNAIAILFPYARAQLTLLTSQPETDPFVMPAFNINALVEDLEKEE